MIRSVLSKTLSYGFGSSRACLASSKFLRPHQLYVIRIASNSTFSPELINSWPEGLRNFLEKENITQPTLIQEKTLSIAMENKDLVGVARTGSGKTLAFIIPAVMKILKSRENEKQQMTNSEQNPLSSSKEDKYDPDERIWMRRARNIRPPKCLVLAPTRELANQIDEVFRKFRFMKINSIALVGGSSRSDQVRALTEQDKDVYIATPGRLMDLVDSDVVDLSQIEYLVLDEADRMLDMGFEPQIRKIISKLPQNRQTLMWSATWPQEIQALASEFMKEYEYIAVDSEKLKANPNIKQIIKVCPPNTKFNNLIETIQKFGDEVETPRILVFVNTKRLVDMLMIQMMRHKIRAVAMHGDRSQKQRESALQLFKSRRCQVLVATDVAARGLDVSDITHVVNYDFPNTIEDYIHRIGRTARHERSGTAVTFFTENEASLARKLIDVLRETQQEIPEELRELAQNQHLFRSKPKNTRSPRRDYYTTGGMFRSRNRNENDFDDDRYNSRYGNQQQWSSNRSRSFGGGNARDRRSVFRDDDEFNDDFDDRGRPSSGNRGTNDGRLRSILSD